MIETVQEAKNALEAWRKSGSKDTKRLLEIKDAINNILATDRSHPYMEKRRLPDISETEDGELIDLLKEIDAELNGCTIDLEP